ncbi:proteasome subunit beta [Candidatus Woesearchaeota archaeon]|nr:proteasome subunit beta [Candidatus Woesearchaeota archaeon]
MTKEEQNYMKTGTTTVGIVCKEGVVLAADKRATAGFLILDKKAEKIHKITDNLAVTIAGTVSDIQLLIRVARSELNLKQIRKGEEITVKEAANLMGRLVYSNIRKFSVIPGVSHFILGGKDSTGFYIYDLFPDGTVTLIDDYVSSGSGSVMAFGVLDTMFKKNMSIDEGVKLATTAINAALQRDAASGEGIDVATITKDGFKKVFSKELIIKI